MDERSRTGASSDGGRGGRPHALVVEDDAAIGLYLENILDDLNCAVEVVASGEAALAAARESAPDLVVMDVSLQGEMDGIEAARRIREFRTCPVVFVTARGDLSANALMREISGAAVLGKPLSDAIFRMTVRDVLRR